MVVKTIQVRIQFINITIIIIINNSGQQKEYFTGRKSAGAMVGIL